MTHKKRFSLSAFTLVELLVVVLGIWWIYNIGGVSGGGINDSAQLCGYKHNIILSKRSASHMMSFTTTSYLKYFVMFESILHSLTIFNCVNNTQRNRCFSYHCFDIFVYILYCVL